MSFGRALNNKVCEPYCVHRKNSGNDKTMKLGGSQETGEVYRTSCVPLGKTSTLHFRLEPSSSPSLSTSLGQLGRLDRLYENCVGAGFGPVDASIGR